VSVTGWRGGGMGEQQSMSATTWATNNVGERRSAATRVNGDADERQAAGAWGQRHRYGATAVAQVSDTESSVNTEHRTETPKPNSSVCPFSLHRSVSISCKPKFQDTEETEPKSRFKPNAHP